MLLSLRQPIEMDLDALFNWAELKGRGGGNEPKKQNLAKMAPWKLIFETLQKPFLGGSAEANSRNH